MQFSGISIALNNAAYLPYCHVKDVEQLCFDPGQKRTFSFAFAVQSQDIGTDLQVRLKVIPFFNRLNVVSF